MHYVSGVFGLPGAGKSCFLAKCAKKALEGKPMIVGNNLLHDGNFDYVLTNFACKGCYQLDAESMLGKVDIHNALILIDEIMTLYDSRDFKSFPAEAKSFFSQIRKTNSVCIWCSQNYRDCDLKIRNLTGKFYYLRPSAIFPSRFSVVSPIDAFLKVDNADIQSGYELAPPLFRSLIYLPRYWGMIDSYATIGQKKLLPFELKSWDDSPSLELMPMAAPLDTIDTVKPRRRVVRP